MWWDLSVPRPRGWWRRAHTWAGDKTNYSTPGPWPVTISLKVCWSHGDPHILGSLFSWSRITHGCSKRSGWSGFGRTSFYGQFRNCTCAGNEISHLRNYTKAITCAYTTPWLQELAVPLIQQHKMISPKSHFIQRTISFQVHISAKESSVPRLPICLV